MDKPVATNRPRYRAGRKETAVKAYTLNQESRFVIVKNVPALGAQEELIKLFALYGTIVEYRLLDEENTTEFTDVYWVKFERVEEARVAKRKCDDYNFLGHLLDVAYAPQFETVSDMREKLEERKRVVARKLRQNYNEATARIREKEQNVRPNPGRVAHEDMPFEPPPDFEPTNMENLPMPQYRNPNTQLYHQPGGRGGRLPAPPKPLDDSAPPGQAVPPGQVARPGHVQGQRPRAPRIPAQVAGEAMVSTYYGDSSVNSSVMSIRNKLKRLSEPVIPVPGAEASAQIPARPAQRKRI